MTTSKASIIKSLRQQKGYSQERLAELAQINLRTIQRLERGETEARGDTLNRIAASLGVAVETFTLVNDADTPAASKTDKAYLLLMNLSALGFLLYQFPFIGIIVTTAMWLRKRDQDAGVREEGRRLINYQFTWLLISIAIYGLCITREIFHIRIRLHFGGALGAPETTLLIIILPPLINLIFIVFNTIRIALDKPVWYKPAIKFIKKAAN